MACLIDLSRKLRVRAEVLRKELSDSGLGEYSLEEDLPEEVTEYLEHQCTSVQSKGLFSRLRGILSRFWRRGNEPLPDEEEVAEEEEEVEEEEESEAEESDDTFVEESPSGQLPPASLPAEEIFPEEFAGEEPVEKLPDLLDALEEVPIGEEVSGAEPVQAEEPGGAEEGVPAEDEALTSQVPEAMVPEEGKPKAATDLLMASLEQIEEIHEDLGVESFGVFEDMLPPLEAEPEDEVEELPLEEESQEEEQISGFVLNEAPEEISSLRLQALVDDLAEGIPDLNVTPAVEAVPLRERLARLIPRIHLSLKQKAALVAAVMAACSLIGTSLFFRGLNYGPGGDKRFFEEGVAYEHAARHEAALEAFEKVVTRYPESPLVLDARKHRAELYHTLGDINGAVNETREALSSQFEVLGEATGEWSIADRDYRLQSLYFLGDIHASEEKWSAASDRFSQVLDEHPPEPMRQRTLYRLADSLYHMEEGEDLDSIRLHGLISANEMALEASPESKWTPVTLFRLSKLWEDQSRFELGIREDDLGKSLEYMRQLESKGLVVGKAGIDPLDVKLRIGQLLRELGKIEESIHLYREILNVPKDPLKETEPPFVVVAGLARSLQARSEVASAQARNASAESDLFEALELVRNREDAPLSDKDLTEALYLRGHSYYQLGVLRPGKPEGSESTYFEKMDNAYQAALSRDEHYGDRGEDSLLAMMRRTNYQFQVTQDYRDAVRSFRRILELFPDSVYSYRVRYRLGSALFQLGEYQEAEQHFRNVVEQFGQTRFVDDKAFRDSYFRLGHCQFLIKDYSRAADTIKTLLRLLDYEETPEALAVWRLLAESYYSQGLYDQAVDEYRKYLERYPNQDPDGKIRLSLGRTLISRFDYDEGRREMQRLIDSDPGSQSARLARYFVCESFLTEYNLAPQANREGLLTRALDQADQLRKAYPSEDTPLYLLGHIHFLMGDYDRAARDLEYFCNAAQGPRPLSQAQMYLGESYFNQKNFKRSADLLSRIDLSGLQRDQAARVLYLLAESQRFEKQFQQAADTYARLAKEFPASPYSEFVEGRIQEVQWRLKQGI